MFGKKLSKEQLMKATHSACASYLEKVISACPSEDELEDRGIYFVNAINQARGMDFLAQSLGSAIGDQGSSIPTAALLSKLEEMFALNLSKLENNED